MHKRLVLIIISILFVVGLVLAATQTFTTSSRLSQTARIQELHPLADTVVATPQVSEEEILKALLTEEQRADLDKQPQDLAAAFSKVSSPRQPVGDVDA